MDEQTIREVLVAAVQSANGHGVKDAIEAAAAGLVEAQKILTGDDFTKPYQRVGGVGGFDEHDVVSARARGFRDGMASVNGGEQ